MSETDIELWHKVKAREELEKRGYQRIKCTEPNCHGTGVVNRLGHYLCPACQGKGYLWAAPLTR
jgi:DnaJ-class molecular chaperone